MSADFKKTQRVKTPSEGVDRSTFYSHTNDKRKSQLQSKINLIRDKYKSNKIKLKEKTTTMSDCRDNISKYPPKANLKSEIPSPLIKPFK